MAYELAIKMVLPINFQYSKEQRAVSGCVNLCAVILDGVCASPKLLQQQEYSDSQNQTSQNFRHI
jgi:hypothetical protein